jgi:hypothetical protein
LLLNGKLKNKNEKKYLALTKPSDMNIRDSFEGMKKCPIPDCGAEGGVLPVWEKSAPSLSFLRPAGCFEIANAVSKSRRKHRIF